MNTEFVDGQINEERDRDSNVQIKDRSSNMWIERKDRDRDRWTLDKALDR